VDAAIGASVPGVLGVHIEGQFINTARHGIHPADKTFRLDRERFDVLTGLKRGRTLVTLTPERTPPA